MPNSTTNKEKAVLEYHLKDDPPEYVVCPACTEPIRHPYIIIKMMLLDLHIHRECLDQIFNLAVALDDHLGGRRANFVS